MTSQSVPEIQVQDMAPVDLDACASEPIHIPGAIQQHGTLLVLDEPSLTVTHAAANLARYLKIAPEEALGRALDQSCPAGAAALRAALAGVDPAFSGSLRFPFRAAFHQTPADRSLSPSWRAVPAGIGAGG
jgi:light-regulated signal transduction histidine kinase (bacteriophytochrome)